MSIIFIENLKNCVKDSILRSKYDPCFKNFNKVTKNKCKKHFNVQTFCFIVLMQWKEAKQINRQMTPVLYGLLRFLVQGQKFEYILLRPAVINKAFFTA